MRLLYKALETEVRLQWQLVFLFVTHAKRASRNAMLMYYASIWNSTSPNGKCRQAPHHIHCRADLPHILINMRMRRDYAKTRK
jgi:hypothetical protein